MSTKMQAEFAGQVGVSPRLVRVSTSDTEAQIKSAGWINQYEASQGVTIAKSDLIFITWDDGESTGIFLPEFGANREITLQGIAGDGGGSFPDQVNTYFVSKAGDDSNSGLNPGDAKLTLNGAIDAIPDITVRTVIYIIDGETYVENIELPVNASLIIMGTNATIQTVDQPISIDAGGLLVLDVYGVTGGAGAALLADGNDQIIAYTVTITGDVTCSNGGRIDLDTEFLTGDIVGNDDISGTIDVLTGNVTKTSSNVADMILDINKLDGNITLNSSQTTMRMGELTGTITLTETLIGDSFFTGSAVRIGGGFSMNFTTANNPRGTFGNEIWGIHDIKTDWLSSTYASIRGLAYKTYEFTNSRTFLASECNQLGILTSASNVDVTAPDAIAAPGLPVGWRTWVVQGSSGNARINVTGGDTLESVSGRRWTEGRGAIAQLTLIAESGGNRTWSWAGNIAGSSLSDSPDVFVSQTEGSDATGTGSESQPFATIAAGVDLIENSGTPAFPHFVRVLDGATYNETITINEPNIGIVAPLATVTQSGVADTFVVNTSSPNPFFMNIGVMQNTGTGALVRFTSDCSFLINTTAFFGDLVAGDAGGTLRCLATISGDMSTNNGNVRWNSTDRLGSDSITGAGTIVGNSADECIGAEWKMLNGASVGQNGGGVQNLDLFSPTTSRGYVRHTVADNVANNFLTVTNAPQSANRVAQYPDHPYDWNFQATTVTPDLGANIIVEPSGMPFNLLSGGAQLNLTFPEDLVTSRYYLHEILLNGFGTNYAGGDRDLTITDGTTVYTVIPAGTLQALVNARWGSTDVPFPAAAGISQLTAAGQPIYAQYSGGTTDYTSGSGLITLIFQRAI